MDFQTPLEQLLLTTTRIVVERNGQFGIGTGFIYSHETKEGSAPFLVTNKHVVAGVSKGRFNFLQGDEKTQLPKLGEAINVEVDQFQDRFFGHPKEEIDLAVMPLVPVLQELEKAGNRIFFRSLSQELIPSEEQLKSLQAMEEITILDYPSGMIDQKNLLPLIRRGTTASPPELDFSGGPVFMVNAPMFPCSGGSPVFIINTQGYVSKQGFVPEVRMIFLGVLSQVALRSEAGEIEMGVIPNGPLPPTIKKQITDMGVALRSSLVVETIEAFMAKVEEMQGGNGEPATPAATPVPDTPQKEESSPKESPMEQPDQSSLKATPE
jgi:hypothetical protein